MSKTKQRRHQGKSSQRTERFFVRFGLWVFAGIVLLVGGIWGGRVLLRHVQEHRLIGQARASLGKGDTHWATIAARRVFELDPKNLDALRLFAELSERSGNAAAVDWRKEVARTAPHSTADQIALARTALRFLQPAVAEEALSHCGSDAAGLAAFHEAKADLALAKKAFTTAAAEYSEAVRLDPANKSYAMKLALCRLHSASAEEHRAAEATLRGFFGEPNLRLTAARALREDAIARQDRSAVVEFGKVVTGFSEAEFPDHLFYLEVLHQLGDTDFSSALSATEDSAAGHPAQLFALLEWMSTAHLSLVALDWAKQLPPEQLATAPVPLAMVRNYIAVRDWAALELWCKQREWGSLEPLRHAAAARAFREQGQTLESRDEWAQALKAAGKDSAKLLGLQQEVAKWKWNRENIELLWMLAKDPERQSSALEELYGLYRESGETGEMYRVTTKLLELRPNDPATQNDFAQLALLLNLETRRAKDLAADLYRRDPANAGFASTYAYALFADGKPRDAAEIVAKLSRTDLQQPAIAAYYAMFLAAAGEGERATEFLRIGDTALLLPEERTAFEKARASVLR